MKGLGEKSGQKDDAVVTQVSSPLRGAFPLAFSRLEHR